MINNSFQYRLEGEARLLRFGLEVRKDEGPLAEEKLGNKENTEARKKNPEQAKKSELFDDLKTEPPDKQKTAKERQEFMSRFVGRSIDSAGKEVQKIGQNLTAAQLQLQAQERDLKGQPKTTDELVKKVANKEKPREGGKAI